MSAYIGTIFCSSDMGQNWGVAQPKQITLKEKDKRIHKNPNNSKSTLKRETRMTYWRVFFQNSLFTLQPFPRLLFNLLSFSLLTPTRVHGQILMAIEEKTGHH